MSAFRLKHLVTGTHLQGYEVLSATDQEIQDANRRLQDQGHPYQFVLSERQSHEMVGTLMDVRIAAPCPASPPAT